MGKKNQKQKKWIAECERRSAKRSSEFVAKQLEEMRDQLCDLLNEFRVFDHYSEIEDASWCLRVFDKLRKKYRTFVGRGVWED